MNVEEARRRTRCPLSRVSDVRCPGCYLPMQWSSACLWWRCDLCGAAEPIQRFEERGLWRRRCDWITGMVG